MKIWDSCWRKSSDATLDMVYMGTAKSFLFEQKNCHDNVTTGITKQLRTKTTKKIPRCYHSLHSKRVESYSYHIQNDERTSFFLSQNMFYNNNTYCKTEQKRDELFIAVMRTAYYFFTHQYKVCVFYKQFLGIRTPSQMMTEM